MVFMPYADGKPLNQTEVTLRSFSACQSNYRICSLNVFLWNIRSFYSYSVCKKLGMQLFVMHIHILWQESSWHCIHVYIHDIYTWYSVCHDHCQYTRVFWFRSASLHGVAKQRSKILYIYTHINPMCKGVDDSSYLKISRSEHCEVHF